MEKKEKISLKRLNCVFKKNSIKIIIILFLFTLCGYFYSYSTVVPKYKSMSTILLASNNLNQEGTSVTQTEVNLNKNLISTYGKILKTNKVLGQVIENLGLNTTTDDLYNDIQIEEVKDTQIIKIGVINESAIEAQKIAKELNKVFVEEIRQYYKINNITIVDDASYELEPYNINHVRDISVFFAVGVLFSVVMVAVIYLFDTTIKIEQDIEEFTGLNVIGAVPKRKSKDSEELIVQHNSKSVISEALKTIRTNISFTKSNGNSRSILFTSCNSGEGKSWIASNMAVAYAQSNKNVIIVDADMRKGRQHKIFKVSNANGLSNCLSEIKDNEDYQTLEKYIQETEIPKVHIIPIGVVPPNPSELLLSSKMKNLIHMLKCVYDVVIVDGTPCNLVSDSIPVSRIVDTTILVTESRKTKIEDLKDVAKSIKNAQGNIEGVILNKKEIKAKEYGKTYYYGEHHTNSAIEIKSYSVQELIKNRKKYEEIDKTLIKTESIENDNISLLSEKIDNLENKLLEIPNINLENYTKIVEDIKNVYNTELDKNKLAEEIKQNIVKNELMKKINETNKETKTIIEEKLKELNYDGKLEEKLKELNYDGKLEEKLKELNLDGKLEEKLKELNYDGKLEEKLKELNLDGKLEEKLKKLNYDGKLEEKLKELNYKGKIQELIDKVNDIENTINQDDTQQTIVNMIYQVKQSQNVKMQQVINYVTSQIKEEQEKQKAQLEKLDNTKFINNVLQKIAEQNDKLENLDNSETLDNIIEEMQNLNTKYDRLESLNNSETLDNIIAEMQKLNAKYDKLSLELNRFNNKQIEEIQDNKNSIASRMHNKIIEMSEIKEKLKKQELFIEFGKGLEYQELEDLAVGVYDVRRNQSEAI